MQGNVASIQFLRFVAASLVAVFHTVQAAHKYFYGSISSEWLYIAGFGESGVHIFFVISGFVMVYTSFSRPGQEFSSIDFLSRRFIRVYPIYIIYAVVYLLFYEFTGNGKGLSPEQLIGAFMLLPGSSSLIIGPGWTLPYEVYFYIWFGVVMILGLHIGIVILTSVFLVSIALRSLLDSSTIAVHFLTSPLLIEFLLGAWIGYAVVSGTRISNRAANLILLLALGGFVTGLLAGYSRFPATAVWAIPSALLVAAAVFREANGRIPVWIRHCSFLGDSSYSLYLLHVMLIDAVVLMLLMNDAGRVQSYALKVGELGVLAFCLAVVALCVTTSIAAYQLVERRVVVALQSLFKRHLSTIRGMQHARPD